MFRSPVDVMAQQVWPKSKAADLRKCLVQILERHLEKKLVTATMLEKLQ
jgi:DNA repair protein RecO (recombination protein O)